MPLVARKFAVGRGYADQCLNDPAFCDLAQVYCLIIDGLDFEQVKQLFDRAADGQWLILCAHKVGPSPANQTVLMSTLEDICKYANDPANELWFDCVDVIGKYIAQQRLAP